MTALTIFQDDDRFIIGPVAQSYGYSMTQGICDAYSVSEAKALLAEARALTDEQIAAKVRVFWTDGRFEAACDGGRFGAAW